MAVVLDLADTCRDDPEAELDELAGVGLGTHDDLQVVGLVFLGDADLDEAVQQGPVLAAVRCCLDIGLDVGEAQDRRKARPGDPPVIALALPVRDPDGLEPGDRWGRRGLRQPVEGEGVDGLGRADPGRLGGFVGPRRRQPLSGRARHDPLLAVPDEAGLHQELDVAVRVGTRDMEPRRAALRALAQQLVHEAVADVTGVREADRIELHDGPLVPRGLALDPDEPGDPAVLLVDVHEVVRAERPEREPEEAEDADRRPADGQPQRPGGSAVGLAQPGELSEGREVGQARRADLARGLGRPGGRHRAWVRRVGWGRRPEPSPGSACSLAMAATSRWNRVSPASSGWNAVAMMLRWRTATTRPSSRRPRTSTSGPIRSTIGARMKTAWTGRSPRTGTGRSASKESS